MKNKFFNFWRKSKLEKDIGVDTKHLYLFIASLEQNVHLPSQSKLIQNSISEFKNKPYDEQIESLPALFLLVEKVISTTSPLPSFDHLQFRKKIKNDFPEITQIDGLKIIFEDESKHPKLLLQKFRHRIRKQIEPIWGTNIDKIYPKLKANPSNKNLSKLILDLEKSLGFDRTANIITYSFTALAKKYKNLDQFAGIISAIPIHFLNEEKVSLLNKNQIESLLIYRIEKEEQISNELRLKNKELAEAKENLEKAYQDLNKNAKLMTAVFDTVGEGILTIDENGNITSFNKEILKIWGYTKEEFENIKLTDLMPIAYRDRHNMGIAKYKKTNESTVMGRWLALEGLKKNGVVFPIEINITETMRNGEHFILTASIRDVTESKKNQDAIKHANETLEKQVEERTSELKKINLELKRSNQELEEFAYIASHDLQEPLRTITSFIQLLEKKNKDKFDDNSRELMKFVTTGAKKMKFLINDLLAYSRVGSKPISFELIDLNEILNLVFGNLQAAIFEKKAKLNIGHLPHIMGDKLLLTQLFQNLIDNAMKFNENVPEIHVLALEKEKNHEIHISDNGIGIAKEFIEKIFTIFQRLHNDNDYQGTGIGLSICKKIVEKHQGTIQVKSRKGKGTTFILSFPKSNLSI